LSGVFVVLAIISGGVALGGTIWSVALGFRSRREAIPVAEDTHKDTASAEDGTAIANAVGVPAVGGDNAGEPVGLSLASAGRQARKQGWRRALPGFLAGGGLLARLIFAAMALLTTLPSKLFGLAALGVALYIAATEMRALQKALRD
jgi:hypothetical protein